LWDWHLPFIMTGLSHKVSPYLSYDISIPVAAASSISSIWCSFCMWWDPTPDDFQYPFQRSKAVIWMSLLLLGWTKVTSNFCLQIRDGEVHAYLSEFLDMSSEVFCSSLYQILWNRCCYCQAQLSQKALPWLGLTGTALPFRSQVSMTPDD
jgi:hypothetical protein